MEWKSICFVLAIILTCFIFIPIHLDVPSEKEWLFESYLKKHNKTYKKHSPEYFERLANFEASVKIIEELNSQHSHPEGAIYGLTKFADLSQKEFKKLYLVNEFSKRLPEERVKKRRKHHHHKRDVSSNLASLPQKVDWRTKGAVTPVKNQKTCGACWAFATVETVESMVAIKNQTLPKLSVQEMIDCAGNYNQGCAGGDPCRLLDWLVKNKIKIETEKEYPLFLMDQQCKLKGPEQGVQVSDFSCTLFADEDMILDKLANHGPVIVAVNSINWQFYLGGVIQFHCPGGIENMNHVVQLVGYDLTSPIPHYIARNSWGTLFGDKGYLKLAYGKDVCGLTTEVSDLNVV